MRLIQGILSAQLPGSTGPAGLTIAEVGADISPDPTYTFNDPDHEVTSGGGTYSQENFGFAYLSLPIADYNIDCHFKTPPAAFNHIGIMLRNENVAPSPVCAAMFLRLVGSTYYQYGYGRLRGDLPYQGLASAGSIGSSYSTHQYLRLKLVGDVVSYWYSADGLSWNQQGIDRTLLDVSGGDAWDNGGIMRAGLTVSASNNTCIFDSFTVTAI